MGLSRLGSVPRKPHSHERGMGCLIAGFCTISKRVGVKLHERVYDMKIKHCVRCLLMLLLGSTAIQAQSKPAVCPKCQGKVPCSCAGTATHPTSRPVAEAPEKLLSLMHKSLPQSTPGWDELTSLQKQQIKPTSDYRGTRVAWVLEVRDVEEKRRDPRGPLLQMVFVSSKSPSTSGAVWPPSDKDFLLSLKKGQRVVVTGKIKDYTTTLSELAEPATKNGGYLLDLSLTLFVTMEDVEMSLLEDTAQVASRPSSATQVK